MDEPFDFILEVVDILPQLLGLCSKSSALINDPLVEAPDKVFDITLDTKETLGHLQGTVVLLLLEGCSVAGERTKG